MHVRAPSAIVLLLVTGCLGNGSEPVEPAAAPELAPNVPQLVAHDADGLLTAVPPAWRELEVRLAETGFNVGEPTLGVASDGTIFVTATRTQLARSTDHGRTWEVVGDAVRDPKANLDPWMWLDPLTDRVYNGPLYVVCSWLAWSDDQGDTWDFNPVAGCGIPAHDHQKITTGPPADGVQTMGYPNVVYYSYNSFRDEGTWVSTSIDGGRTFSLGTLAHPSDCHAGIAGPVAVGPEGTAYSPKPACDGVNVAVSRDSGLNWEVTAEINDHGIQESLAVNPDIATDSAGNAYLVWPGDDGQIYIATSQDLGDSWSAPARVTPPEITATAFSVVTAADPGRIAIGYLGTTADTSDWDTKSAEDASDDVVWHAYMTFSDDALNATPTFVTARITPDDDPVQIGCIWQSGGGNPCRNLLDFIDMVQWEGRAYMVYADGCDKCSSTDESRRSDRIVAIVERGPSLAAGILEPLVPGQAAEPELARPLTERVPTGGPEAGRNPGTPT